MSTRIDEILRDRFASQTDDVPPPDFDDVRLRARGYESTATRRSRRRRLRVGRGTVALAAALAIGGGTATALAVVAPWTHSPPTPREVAKQTGKPVDPVVGATVDRLRWSVYVYRTPSGDLCFAERTGGNESDTSGLGWDCPGAGREPLFADGPVRVDGPTLSRNQGTAPDVWDHASVYGLASSAVARVGVRFTDCIERQAVLQRDAFEGANAFLYVAPTALLHTHVLPYELRAYNGAGTTVFVKKIGPTYAPNGDAPPAPNCR
jgi:hypothetical protein